MNITQSDYDRKINVRSAGHNRQGAYLNARARSDAAFKRHFNFFSDPAHLTRVDATIAIVNAFFKVRGTMYVNSREGRNGKPFTAIKLAKPQWPVVKPAEKQSAFIDPLMKLGVERVFSPQTNSWIFRVY